MVALPAALAGILARLGLTTGQRTIAGRVITTLRLPSLVRGGTAVISALMLVILTAFIFEEAIQALSLSTWVAISWRRWDIVERNCRALRQLISDAEEFVNSFVDPLPYVGNSFVAFLDAATVQVDTFERIARAQRRRRRR